MHKVCIRWSSFIVNNTRIILERSYIRFGKEGILILPLLMKPRSRVLQSLCLLFRFVLSSIRTTSYGRSRIFLYKLPLNLTTPAIQLILEINKEKYWKSVQNYGISNDIDVKIYRIKTPFIFRFWKVIISTFFRLKFKYSCRTLYLRHSPFTFLYYVFHVLKGTLSDYRWCSLNSFSALGISVKMDAIQQNLPKPNDSSKWQKLTCHLTIQFFEKGRWTFSSLFFLFFKSGLWILLGKF